MVIPIYKVLLYFVIRTFEFKYEYIIMYMLGTKHGFAQSMDGTAQSADPRFAQQSVDCPLIPRIAQTEGKVGIGAIRRLS